MFQQVVCPTQVYVVDDNELLGHFIALFIFLEHFLVANPNSPHRTLYLDPFQSVFMLGFGHSLITMMNDLHIGSTGQV